MDSSDSILVATADAIQFQILKPAIESAGYQAVHAESADEALDRLDHGIANIATAIVDLSLAGEDGLDIVRVIRYLDPDRRIRTVVRCDPADEHDKVACIAAGADTVAPLRIEPDALPDLVRRRDDVANDSGCVTALAG